MQGRRAAGFDDEGVAVQMHLLKRSSRKFSPPSLETSLALPRTYTR